MSTKIHQNHQLYLNQMASATGNNLYLLKQSQNRHKELCLLSPIYNAHWTIGISSVHTNVLPCRPIVQLQTFFSLLGSPDLPSTRVPHVPTVAHHATFNQPQFMASESKQKSRFLTCDKLTLHKQKNTLCSVGDCRRIGDYLKYCDLTVVKYRASA